jgi:hypothetical protein
MARVTVTKKRNPPDSTLRNVRAADRRFDKLAVRVRRLETTLAVLSRAVRDLGR